MQRRQYRHLWIRSLLITPLALLFIIGCGGGGGSTSDSGEETPPPNPLLQAIETAVSALDEEAERGAALEKLYVSNELAGNLVPMARGESPPDSPSCVTVETEGEALILSFDGTEDCKGVSGSLRIRSVSRDFGDPTLLVTDVTLIDFDTGDGCPVNGDERSHITIDGSHITAVVTYSDLDVCGQLLSGQVVLDGEPPTDWQVEMQARTYRYGNDAVAAVDLVWQPETGRMQGEATVQLDGKTYVMAADAIVIDPACGLPIQGGLTITDPQGDSSTADFSDTGCDAPLVNVTREATTEQWPLQFP